MSCKHRKTWIVVGPAEWCYQCGAFRLLKHAGDENILRPASVWVVPTGSGGENPYDRWYRRSIKKYLNVIR